MPDVSRNRIGELSVFASAVCWSLFPVLTILSYTSLTPIITAALNLFIGGLFFAVVITARGHWYHLLRREAWKPMLLTGIILGICFFGLMFSALQFTTAGNASILGLMETFFSFLILGFILKQEPITKRSVIGGLCMIAGALIILLPKASGWHMGDPIVVLATAVAPLGNMQAKKARKIVSSEIVMFVRSCIGGTFLFLLASFIEPTPTISALQNSVGLLLFSGIVVFGISKILWMEGIHRIPITIAVALSCIIPALTMVFAYILLKETVAPFQIAGFLPIVFGIYLLMKKEEIKKAAGNFPAAS